MNSQLHIHSPKRMVRNHSAEPHGERMCTAFGASSIPGCIPSCANQPESALCTLSTSASIEAAENSCRSILSPTHSAVSGSHVLSTCVTAAVSAVTAWENFLRGNTRISEQHSLGGVFFSSPSNLSYLSQIYGYVFDKIQTKHYWYDPGQVTLGGITRLFCFHI